jgi:hypothetical protein
MATASNRPTAAGGAGPAAERKGAPPASTGTPAEPYSLGPSEAEVDAWAERGRRRREGWLSGPTADERAAWTQRERERRLGRFAAAPGDGVSELGRRAQGVVREAQLAAEGAVHLLWKGVEAAGPGARGVSPATRRAARLTGHGRAPHGDPVSVGSRRPGRPSSAGWAGPAARRPRGGPLTAAARGHRWRRTPAPGSARPAGPGTSAAPPSRGLGGGVGGGAAPQEGGRWPTSPSAAGRRCWPASRPEPSASAPGGRERRPPRPARRGDDPARIVDGAVRIAAARRNRAPGWGRAGRHRGRPVVS